MPYYFEILEGERKEHIAYRMSEAEANDMVKEHNNRILMGHQFDQSEKAQKQLKLRLWSIVKRKGLMP